MFQVTQTGKPEFDVSIVVGKTAKDGKASAEELAKIIYASAPTNDPAGQQFKNTLMSALMSQSDRCKRAAAQVLGTGKAKAVIGETKGKDCCD